MSIINNSDNEIEINGFLNRDSAFTITTPLPIVIGALDHKIVHVLFKPRGIKNYSDNLYLQWNKKGQRITQVVHLSATNIVGVQNNNIFNFSLFQNYPNPFNPSTKIEYSVPHSYLVTLKVDFNGSDLSSGIYFYELQAGVYTSVKKMILMK